MNNAIFLSVNTLTNKNIILFIILFIASSINAKNKEQLPSIQQAWVDAGYFVWKDSTKTSLKITERGINQDTLPDVCDGEQLTSAAWMFSNYDPDDNLFIDQLFFPLKKIPLFNTQNITNFEGMFYGCSKLETIPLLDTAKGETFSEMFRRCFDLKTIPQLNTSKGINFNFMFSGCYYLETIPMIDTSRGKDFTDMFSFCRSLKTIPLINTSRGLNFDRMFFSCQSLETVPALDISRAIYANYMFEDCLSLKAKPNILISSYASTKNIYLDTPFENE